MLYLLLNKDDTVIWKQMVGQLKFIRAPLHFALSTSHRERIRLRISFLLLSKVLHVHSLSFMTYKNLLRILFIWTLCTTYCGVWVHIPYHNSFLSFKICWCFINQNLIIIPYEIIWHTLWSFITNIGANIDLQWLKKNK